MGKITLKDAEGIEFTIDTGVINEIHRQGEQASIVDADGNETLLSDSIEELLNKVLYSQFGEV